MLAFSLQRPDGILSQGQAERVQVSGTEGDMGILIGHMPLISGLKDGSQVQIFRPDLEAYVVGGAIVRITGQRVEISAQFAIGLADLTPALLDDLESAQPSDPAYRGFCQGIRQILHARKRTTVSA